MPTLSRAISAEIRSRIARSDPPRLTGEQIAKMLPGENGNHRSTNYVIERLRGDKAFSVEDLYIISAALGASMNELVSAALLVTDPPAVDLPATSPRPGSPDRSGRRRPRARGGE